MSQSSENLCCHKLTETLREMIQQKVINWLLWLRANWKIHFFIRRSFIFPMGKKHIVSVNYCNSLGKIHRGEFRQQKIRLRQSSTAAKREVQREINDNAKAHCIVVTRTKTTQTPSDPHFDAFQSSTACHNFNSPCHCK